jgi:NAD(P)H-dependent FMN reductase
VRFIDDLFREWNNKAARFVSYGGIGGASAVEHLRLMMAKLMVADVRSQLIAWGTALKAVRSNATTLS